MRQVLTESLLLSGAGALLGVLLAQIGTGVLVRIIASGREHERFTSSGTARPTLAGLHRRNRADDGLALRAGSRLARFSVRAGAALRQTGRAGETRLGRLFGRGLVAAQVASSILLLSAAGLFVGHLSHLKHLDLGFQREACCW